MSLIERWGVGSERRGGAARCGEPVITQSLKCSPKEARERGSSSLVKRQAEDVRCPCGPSCEERAKEQQKGRGTTRGRNGRIARARAINTRITIPATNVVSDFFLFVPRFSPPPSPLTLLSDPCGYDVYARAYTFSTLRLLFRIYAQCKSLSVFLFLTLSPLILPPCPCAFRLRARIYSFSLVLLYLRISALRSSSVCIVARAFLRPAHRFPRYIFQRRRARTHAALSWVACINIRLIMLDATIASPRMGHRCAQVRFFFCGMLDI